jgi:hypothetical protein
VMVTDDLDCEAAATEVLNRARDEELLLASIRSAMAHPKAAAARHFDAHRPNRRQAASMCGGTGASRAGTSETTQKHNGVMTAHPSRRCSDVATTLLWRLASTGFRR